MAFFSRWWEAQKVPMQQKVRHLIHQGRLQFAGGGWTQNDEAVTHYSAIIDNLALGFKFIANAFGNSYKQFSNSYKTENFSVYKHSKN